MTAQDRVIDLGSPAPLHGDEPDHVMRLALNQGVIGPAGADLASRRDRTPRPFDR